MTKTKRYPYRRFRNEFTIELVVVHATHERFLNIRARDRTIRSHRKVTIREDTSTHSSSSVLSSLIAMYHPPYPPYDFTDTDR